MYVSTRDITCGWGLTSTGNELPLTDSLTEVGKDSEEPDVSDKSLPSPFYHLRTERKRLSTCRRSLLLIPPTEGRGGGVGGPCLLILVYQTLQ